MYVWLCPHHDNTLPAEGKQVFLQHLPVLSFPPILPSLPPSSCLTLTYYLLTTLRTGGL